MSITPAPALTTALKTEARRLGFELAGVCPAVAPTGMSRFHEWLDAGFGGEMHYLADRAAAYEHPRHVLDGVRSIVMLAMVYRTAEPADPQPGEGRVSRYAWGDDYHDLIRQRLNRLTEFLVREAPGSKARGVVDTAPLLEREFAQLAGLGWIGKNTLLLNKRLGSWFFLAALLTDLELEYDEPHAADHCGTCRACLDACPTQAFVAPYVLDARRCISYLTIELRESIPVELREGVGDWLFGCDVCQDVCPWNHRAPSSVEPAFQPSEGMNPVDVASLFALDDAAFRAISAHAAMAGQATRLAPQRRHRARKSARSGDDPGACPRSQRSRTPCARRLRLGAWTIPRAAASAALTARRAIETDQEVLAEIPA